MSLSDPLPYANEVHEEGAWEGTQGRLASLLHRADRFVRNAVPYDRNKNSGTSAATELVMEAMVILNAVSLRASFSILFGRGYILPPPGHSFLFQPEPKQMLLERD